MTAKQLRFSLDDPRGRLLTVEEIEDLVDDLRNRLRGTGSRYGDDIARMVREGNYRRPMIDVPTGSYL